MSRSGAKLAVIEGTRPVIEALLAARRKIHEIWLPNGDSSPARRELEALLSAAGIPTHASRPEEGVHALADPYPEEEFEALLEGASRHFLIALDRVTDVGNLGSIARTAEAAGATGLVLEYRNAPPIAAGALRTSAGALEHLRVGRTPNLVRALDLAAEEGIAVLVADVGAPPIAQLPGELLRGDLILVLGSEDRGARPGVLRRASVRVGIPLAGKTSSLGVAAAAAYLIFRIAEARSAGENKTNQASGFRAHESSQVPGGTNEIS